MSLGNVVYFGSLEDGFKVYPELGAASNLYASYYTNAESDWVLVVKKSGIITSYTYVRYGLLTSLTRGRTGSCLGISIDFQNSYFTDMQILRTQIFEEIWEVLLSEGKLIAVQETSGKVAFKSYNLFDIGAYLDAKTQVIKKVILQDYKKYVKASSGITDAANNPIYGLHPDSSPKAISEYLENYGSVKLSPKLPIEKKAISEKAEEHNKILQKQLDNVNKVIKQKDNEIENLKEDNKKLRSSLQKVEDDLNILKFQQQQKSQQHPTTDEPKKENRLFSAFNKLTKEQKRLVAVIAMLLLMSILALLLFPSSSDDNRRSTNTQPASPSRVETEPVAKPHLPPSVIEPIIEQEDNGKLKGFLAVSTFLETNRGKTVKDEEDFKELLISYLMTNSKDVANIYKQDKATLWNTIVKANPTNNKEISSFINREKPFVIESNDFQQKMLRDMLIYSK